MPGRVMTKPASTRKHTLSSPIKTHITGVIAVPPGTSCAKVGAGSCNVLAIAKIRKKARRRINVIGCSMFRLKVQLERKLK